MRSPGSRNGVLPGTRIVVLWLFLLSALPIDYLQLNKFPEWFTTGVDKHYEVRNVIVHTQQTVSGKRLQEGLNLELKAGQEVRLVVREK